MTLKHADPVEYVGEPRQTEEELLKTGARGLVVSCANGFTLVTFHGVRDSVTVETSQLKLCET